MTAKLTGVVRERLEAPTYWHLACLNADGSPQASPMWLDLRGESILINTAKSHLKYKNLARRPLVAMSNNDATDNPFDHIQIRGRVVEIIEGEQAEGDIDDLCQKYTGESPYPWRAPGEQRVSFLIEPTHVRHFSPS
jgi:PPOX class probable F420-dependent enzyme